MNSISANHNSFRSRLWLAISLLALLGLLALPSGMAAWFDGLPWSGALETVLITAIIPFLLLGCSSFLASKKIGLLLLCMLALKLALALWAPASGWAVKAYESPQALAEARWEQTYQTIWRQGISALLDRPWFSYQQFPIEWMNRYDANARQNRRVILSVQGGALIPSGERLVLKATGTGPVSLWLINQKGQRWKLPVLTSASADNLSGAQFPPPGEYKVEGQIAFGPGGDWSLIPVLQDSSGGLTSALERSVLWRGQEAARMGAGVLTGLGWLAKLLDMGIVLFLAVWAGFLLRGLWRDGYLNQWLACLAAFGLGAPLALSRIQTLAALDATGILPLAASMTLAAVVLSIFAFSKTGVERLGKLNPVMFVIIVLGPGIIGYLLFNWWYHLGAMHFYSIGDDWLVYQNYGRQIFVEGDWWSSFEPLIFYQPGYRYIVGFLHVVFGQSALAQHMLDAWCVAGAAALLAALARLLGALPGWAMLGCAFYLFNELAGGFRHHLGRSMSEHCGMLFMLLAMWGAARSRIIKPGRALYPALAAVFGFWLRMDHLGALAGAGLFRQLGRGAGRLASWRRWLEDLWRDRRWPLIYWSLLILAVLTVLLRNKIMGGLCVLNDPSNVDRWDITSLYGAWVGICRILNADDNFVKFSALVLWPGAMAGLAALFWRRGPLAGYPLCLALTMAGALSPYVFLLPNGCPPRFSVHILPLACLSLVCLGQAIQDWRRAKRPSA